MIVQEQLAKAHGGSGGSGGSGSSHDGEVEGIAEDSLAYLREKRVPETLEYIVRSLLRDRPEHPVKYINTLTAKPLPPHIIIAGPPASGKGTQCSEIRNYFKRKTGCMPVHISSGDLLREQVNQRTRLGVIAEGYMKAGQLVPDTLIIGMIRERMQADDVVLNGWLLDGFPRTREQAIALDAEGFSPDLFIVLDVPDEVLVARVEGRRVDPATDTIYHLTYNPPPQDDYALLDRLEQRSDDTREVLVPRLHEFHQYVNGMLEHYATVAEHVQANAPEADVARDVVACVEKHRLV